MVLSPHPSTNAEILPQARLVRVDGVVTHWPPPPAQLSERDRPPLPGLGRLHLRFGKKVFVWKELGWPAAWEGRVGGQAALKGAQRTPG